MKITYSAYIEANKVLKEGFETSELAIKFCDEHYPKLPFVINRDHVNSKGKITKSAIICRSNPHPPTTK